MKAIGYVALIHPPNNDEERNFSGITDEQVSQAWKEYRRVEGFLLDIGFEGNGSLEGELEWGGAENENGRQFEGHISLRLLKIQPKLLDALLGNAKRVNEIREQALAKLSDEEKQVLGVIEPELTMERRMKKWRPVLEREDADS